MLLATPNHNLPELTDNLVNQLKRDPYFKNCELMVVDNGSKDTLAKSTTHRLEKNVFYGGAFNVVLDYFLSTNHDYLYFLSNDLIFHGPSFLTTSLKEAKKTNAGVYSPSVINASIDQCHWKQMWNWGKGLRAVRWIDFQCPLLRRDILEKIGQFPEDFTLGWGLDFYAGCVAEENGITTIVSDEHTICHLNSQTFAQNKIDIKVEDFCRGAESNMYNYFRNSKYYSKYMDLRAYGETYSA
jgi:GT2 family glycosyltransferase